MNCYLLTVLVAVFGFCLKASAATWITHADEITEEWLADVGAETSYTDHIPHFKRVFNKIPVSAFLEFGVGFSTKFFIDHCKEVISVEFVTPGSGPEWLKNCMDLFRHCNHWTPIAFFSGYSLDTSWATHKYTDGGSVYKAASYQPVQYKSYALIDPLYFSTLSNFIDQQVNAHDVDVAFVDAGLCIRGDLVQQLFNKVPIIAAHDICPKELRQPDSVFDPYGYGRIVVPENYEEIHIPRGAQTGFWIKKEAKYLELIKDLQEYASQFLCPKAVAAKQIKNADEITEYWLLNHETERSFADHIPIFKRIFYRNPESTFLEFGMGYLTKYFIDNCKKVISVDFVTPGTGPEWLKYCVDLYRNCSSWIPITIFSGNGLDTNWAPHKFITTDAIYKAASYQPVHHKSYASIDSSYLNTLNGFVNQQTMTHEVDIAFVDVGICLRGDLVQVLFNKVPMIIAHGILGEKTRKLETTNDLYGYGRIVVPDNYVEIHLARGAQTAVWIKKEGKYLELIEDLQSYASTIP